MGSACLYGRVWPMLMLGQVGPMLSHRAPLGPILAQVGPMLGYVGPILGPCWAYVGLCWPMLALWPHVEPPWELRWGHFWAIYVS